MIKEILAVVTILPMSLDIAIHLAILALFLILLFTYGV